MFKRGKSHTNPYVFLKQKYVVGDCPLCFLNLNKWEERYSGLVLINNKVLLSLNINSFEYCFQMTSVIFKNYLIQCLYQICNAMYYLRSISYF